MTANAHKKPPVAAAGAHRAGVARRRRSPVVQVGAGRRREADGPRVVVLRVVRPRLGQLPAASGRVAACGSCRCYAVTLHPTGCHWMLSPWMLLPTQLSNGGCQGHADPSPPHANLSQPPPFTGRCCPPTPRHWLSRTQSSTRASRPTPWSRASLLSASTPAAPSSRPTACASARCERRAAARACAAVCALQRARCNAFLDRAPRAPRPRPPQLHHRPPAAAV